MRRKTYVAVLVSGMLLGVVLSVAVYSVTAILSARRAANEETYTSEQMLEVYQKVRRSALVVRTRVGTQVLLGSGVMVLSEGGRTVAFTNAHVVAPNGKAANVVEVKPFGSRTFREARVLRILADESRNLDLAVLVFGDRWGRDVAATIVPENETITPGKVIIAVGNPRGDEFLTDHGRIREVSQRQKVTVIIHDALTEHGSSGGGLFDLHGHLLGINTWLVAERYGVAAEIHSILREFRVDSDDSSDR